MNPRVPGAQRVSLETELERVVPVVSALTQAGVAVSIDTTRAAVARACVAAGARMVNDVSGGLADEDMLPSVADLGVDFVAMHWRAHSERMQEFTDYGDVVEDVELALRERLSACEDAGIAGDRVVLDPGLGLRQGAAPQLAVAARPAPARRHRASGPGGCIP